MDDEQDEEEFNEEAEKEYQRGRLAKEHAAQLVKLLNSAISATKRVQPYVFSGAGMSPEREELVKAMKAVNEKYKELEEFFTE